MSNLSESKSTPLNKSVEEPKSGAARATMAGAIIAAVAASSCCVLPAVLAIVGVSGVGAAAALESYRPLFLGATVVLLGIGFYLVYRKPKATMDGAGSADDCGCPAPRARRSGKPMLWIGALAVVFFAGYPYIAGAFAQTEKTGDATLTGTSKQLELHVDGMTCESCATAIVNALTEIPGVVKASVAFAKESASVTYDPNRVKPAALLQAVSALDGYSAIMASPVSSVPANQL